MGAQRRGPWKNFFNFPGGKIDPDESIPAAAAREAREETGFRIDEIQLTWLGRILVRDYCGAIARLGNVEVFGMNGDFGEPVPDDPAEIDCLWVDPTDRNILLNMPADVKYWLPHVFAEPRRPFMSRRVIDHHDGETYTTFLGSSSHRLEMVEGFQFNL